MSSSRIICSGLAAAVLGLFALPAAAQSFRVQCPAGTVLHPADVTADPAITTAAEQAKYDTITRPLDLHPAAAPAANLNILGKLNPTPAMANPHIKCQQISGGDGFATMGDGTQTYLFAFGPLSGLNNIVNGRPGTTIASEFLQSNVDATGNVLDRPSYSVSLIASRSSARLNVGK